MNVIILVLYDYNSNINLERHHKSWRYKSRLLLASRKNMDNHVKKTSTTIEFKFLMFKQNWLLQTYFPGYPKFSNRKNRQTA